MKTTAKIETLDQLRNEIHRLQDLSKLQEEQIKSDFRILREELKPENIIWNLISSLTGIQMKKNEFFKNGIAYGASMLLQRFLLKSEQKLEDKIYGIVDSVVDWINHFIQKFVSPTVKREQRKEEHENVASNE